ncbi:MAG: DUF1801 domain-containing protein [Phycisphaerales bacterium]|nr:DUF1801 domain-containing protein [Phycisphaerales bacterium]
MARKTTSKKTTPKKAATKKAATKKAVTKKAVTKKAVTKKAAPKKMATTPYGKRDDFGAPVETYLEKIEDETIRDLATRLVALVRKAAPKAEEGIKWGVPTWTQHGPFCAVAISKSCAKLQFFDAGTSLTDPEGLLEGTGKGCRHVKVHAPGDIRPGPMRDMIREAIAFHAARAT